MNDKSFIERLENPRLASRVSSVIVIVCWIIWVAIYFSGVENGAEIHHDESLEVSDSKNHMVSNPELKNPSTELNLNISIAETKQVIQKMENDAPSDINAEIRSAEDQVKSLFQTGSRACKYGNIVGAKLVLSEMESISSSLPSSNSRIDSKIKELHRKIVRAEKKLESSKHQPNM